MAYAVMSGAGDNAGAGSQHNGMYYARPDGRVMFLPHDMDLGLSATRSIFANSECNKITGNAARRRGYLGHLYDICKTTYNNRYMSMWSTHMASFDSSQPWSSHLSFVNSRSDNILSQINSQVSPVSFSITTPDPLSVNSSIASVTGNGWVNVREIRIAGSPGTLRVTWLDNNSWQVNVPVVPGLNTVTFEALDFQGRGLGTQTINVSNTSQIDPASAVNLAISEIHYHPLPPTLAETNLGFMDQDLFEFIELRNVSGNTIDLTGVQFIEGVEFDFPSGRLLTPGEPILTVRDTHAFRTRYAAVSVGAIAGEFANDRGLRDSGERLHLIAADGSTIANFTYSDDFPWPEDADGNGRSLIYITDDPERADNWRNSTTVGGNPAENDSVPFVGNPLADDDNDGLTALMEHFLGTDDTSELSGPGTFVLTITPTGTVRVSFPRDLAADDVVFTVDGSDDLMTWSIEEAFFYSETANLNGTSTVTYELLQPLSAGIGFARLVVQLR
ncbi:MAG TPA: lamin tail domain-containing protein [Verrucomicrobiales bacterium]|nr:lamin tail domain-containing protein [Verrucomicrobiales bacterium]